MPRPRNLLKSSPLRLAATPQMREYLSQLVHTGLYGKNPTEAANQLLSEGIRAAMRDRVFKEAREFRKLHSGQR